jgi:hypothetical protein
MAVTRAAGPDGALTVLFDAGVALDAASLTLDGKPLPPALRAALAPDPQSHGETLTSTGSAAAAEFLRGIRDGTDLTIGLADKTDTVRVSLRGLAAALLLIDDVQGRVGGQTALARPGPAPASDVPAALALPPIPPPPPRPPVLSEKTAKRLTAALRASATVKRACDNLEEDAASDDAVMLNKTQALVSVVCAVGAYRKVWRLFLVPPGQPQAAQPLTLKVPLRKDPIDDFVNIAFDPATGRLDMHDPCRSVGDCGQSATWYYDGRQFHLTAYRFLDLEGGRPGAWPTLWRSAQ